MLQVTGRVNSEGVVLLYLGGEQSLVILWEVWVRGGTCLR